MPRRRALKLGQVAQPLRAALTGSTASPGIFEVMAVLGREETLARIADAVARPSCRSATWRLIGCGPAITDRRQGFFNFVRSPRVSRAVGKHA